MQHLVLWHRTLPPLFEDEDYANAANKWADYVQKSVRDAGGTMLSAMAGTLVAAFAPDQVQQVVKLCLTLADHAERVRVPADGMRVAFGVAMGDVERSEDRGVVITGSAIDTAQVLANVANASEIVLDTPSREAAERWFLFSRSVNADSVAQAGEVLDRLRPHRRNFARQVTLLAEPKPPASIVKTLGSVLSSAGATDDHNQVLLLVGPRGTGAYEAVLGIARQVDCPLLMRLAGVPGALEPLGSLRLGLLHHWGSAEQVRQAIEPVDLKSADALEAVAFGEPPPREAVVEALCTVVRFAREQGKAPWFYLDPVQAIDVATLGVMRDAFSEAGCGSLIIARSPSPNAPQSLKQLASVRKVVLPPLPRADCVAIVGHMLGLGTDSPLVRQVADFGATSMVSAVEMVRALICNADIVYENQTFHWRGDRSSLQMPSQLLALIQRRIDTLDADTRRVLEIAAATLQSSGLEPMMSACLTDGISAEATKEAIGQLRTQRLLNDDAKPASEPIRRAVIEYMTPERRGQVYRFVGAAIRDTEKHCGPALLATVGMYQCEGGQTEAGVQALLQTGALIASLGYKRAAVRLAATAVRYDPGNKTRKEAQAIGQAVIAPTEPPAREDDTETRQTDPRHLAPTLSDLIVEAIANQEHARVDSLFEDALSTGCQPIPVECLRAVSHASRQQHDLAADALLRAKRASLQDPDHLTKVLIAQALVSISKRRLTEALHQSLTALAKSKEGADATGERAARHTIAVVYDAIGQESVAQYLRV